MIRELYDTSVTTKYVPYDTITLHYGQKFYLIVIGQPQNDKFDSVIASFKFNLNLLL